MPFKNQQIADHAFLQKMFEDDYYPDHLVAKARSILQRLCERIEAENPADLPALYTLTQAATEEINVLTEEFYEADSEIETVARDFLAEDFWFIATAYDFPNADLEELVANRDW
ncbi:DUF5713 family protein [Actinomadura decatromicini]|uniref:Uncharacterized protein n=1 Tax=Actinomadura decatromicini TaxID=2604572 RepID=A0A5D3F7D1_9ACTN|nr:DUF5713 family protein [Actinomadura decatromicini]TYK43848.1 hypothetical protein FXF68_37605 [Actinomadura decatromicini]